MMNKTSNSVIFTVALFLVFAFSFSLVSARGFGYLKRNGEQEQNVGETENTERNANGKAIGGKGFCESFSQIKEKIDQKINDRQSKLSTKVTERQNQLDEKFRMRDERMDSVRAKWDGNREEQFAKLEEAAKSGEQKAAVEKFEETVTAAIEARRTAIDTAIDKFRKGIEDLISGRNTKVDSLVGVYESCKISAFEKSQTDCDAASANPQTVRKTLMDSLKTCQKNFKTGRISLEGVRSDVQGLKKERDDAIKSATSSFKETMEKAREELEKAFPEIGDDAEDENKTE